MLTRILLALCVVCVFVLVGCSKTETNDNNSTAGNANKSAPKSSPATGTSSTTSADKIGVPDCDDFLEKYDACVSSKVPEMARGQYKDMLDQWRKSWRDLAANPATKSTLAAACKQAAEQQATALKSYGCAF